MRRSDALRAQQCCRSAPQNAVQCTAILNVPHVVSRVLCGGIGLRLRILLTEYIPLPSNAYSPSYPFVFVLRIFTSHAVTAAYPIAAFPLPAPTRSIHSQHESGGGGGGGGGGGEWRWTLNWNYVTDDIIVGSCPRSPEDVVRLWRSFFLGAFGRVKSIRVGDSTPSCGWTPQSLLARQWD